MKETCAFEGCGRPRAAKGYCQNHYEAYRHGKELKPLRVCIRYPQPAPGKKICTECGQVKDIDDFYKRTRSHKPQSKCKVCVLARKAARKAKEKETKEETA